jgi:hypothetical protein
MKIRITRREQIFAYTLIGEKKNLGKGRVMLSVCSHFQLLNSDQIWWSWDGTVGIAMECRLDSRGTEGSEFEPW